MPYAYEKDTESVYDSEYKIIPAD
jgi:hypothetical protein